MLKDKEIVITDESGTETLCEILFTHEANGKTYVVFEFPDTLEISAAVYETGDSDDAGELHDVETDQEWEMLDELLQAYYDENEDESEDDEDDDLDEEASEEKPLEA